MEDPDGDSIYTAKILVKYDPEVPVEYKFKILPNRNISLPNNGWESVQNRILDVNGRKKIKAPYIEFGDIRRVARFIVDAKNLISKKVFLPLKGDILQIELNLDGKCTLTDALTASENSIYETAVMIPLKVKKIRYRLVKNINIPLTDWRDIFVGIRGKITNIK
ncbi:MAG: hypothetical protein H0Z29_07365 [Candidatus Marinimicrobia bacterium]|nr:hypothetical protein [Candidatus Neomarinimicrobiota bacterium]